MCVAQRWNLVLRPAKFALVRLDSKLAVAQTTSNLNQLLGIEINPNFMCEYNNSVYLNNPSTGILVFDILVLM